MSFWSEMTKAALAATDAAAQHQQKNQRRRGGGGPKKPECTPCAAQAYVDSFRPPPQR